MMIRPERLVPFVFSVSVTLMIVACSQQPAHQTPSPLVRAHQQALDQPNSQPKLVVQLSHASPISAMALSENGRFLVTASWGEAVRLWDATTGQELRRFNGHDGDTKAVALSADGHWLLTGGEDTVVCLWNTKTGTRIFRLTGHAATVTSVAFSSDGKLLISGSDDRAVRVWDSGSGKEHRRFEGHASEVFSATFTPNGRYAVVGSHTSAYLWDIAKGKFVRRFDGHQSGVRSVAVSPTGEFILTGGNDHTARLWDINKGHELQRFKGHADEVLSVSFSSDGKFVLTGSKDATARVWSTHDGKQLGHFRGHPHTVSSVAFSPNQRFIYAASGNIVWVWETTSGKHLRSFEGNSELVSAVSFSPDGKYILIGSWDDTARLWDTTSGRGFQRLQGHFGDVRASTFSADGRLILTGSRDGTARLWDATSGSELHRFKGHSEGVRSVAFSPDGNFVLTGSDDKTVWLWEAGEPFKKHQRIGPHPRRVTDAVFSPDSQALLTSSDNVAYLWNIKDGKTIKTFSHNKLINAVSFSPDGQLAVTASWDKTARIWDIRTGKERSQLRGHSSGVTAAMFSPDGRFVITGSEDNTARLWRTSNGKEVRRLSGHDSGVTAVAFSPQGRFILTGSSDQTARLWRTSTGEELCRLINFRDGGWAVVDSTGRFDAANGGDVQGLHWVIDRYAIALRQLKERYYDPGLLAKKLGLHPESVRDVVSFEKPKLFPRVNVESVDPANPMLKISLANQGGGMGKVSVSLNGKEVTADARGGNLETHADSIQLNVDLRKNPFLIPGQENLIEVRAFNAEGYLSSRGVTRTFQPPGEISGQLPTLWAVVSGISDYEGDRIDLRFAAKDAQDMTKALTLAGRRLFGADHVRVNLLTKTTKQAFVEAFEEIKSARPWDILIIYLAGHGIAMGDDYYYLTGEARSTELGDPEVRARVSVSSAEMVEWLKQSPALKQVMVLDTCQAGAAAKIFMEQREISSSQVRALERLKDRTGFHVLMGSAANAVSFEASQFEQGLLTHALLKGMKGAALREDEFVDVSLLFQYAADQVPMLAAHIGGIQRPRIAAPIGTSFAIGQLINEDRVSIPLSVRKPMLLQPMFLNARELLDNLRLTVKLRKRFREESYNAARGEAGPLPAVYIDTDQVPGAIRPTGTYVIDGGTVTINIVLGRGEKNLSTVSVRGPANDLDSLTERVVHAIFEAVAGLKSVS